MIGEVIAIGDELTSGQRLDTNSQWLSQRLGEMGVRVVYHTTVADDLEAGERVFREAISRADVVVASGGLGPTADDLTRQTLAHLSGRELLLDEEVLERIRKMFAFFGRDMPEQNEIQAMFPAGSRVIPNRNGTAPGIDMEMPRADGKSCRIFALPGVPAEMKPMWNETVAEAILSSAGEHRVIRHRRIKCFGVGESHLEKMLPDLIRRGRKPTVGITVSSATITLRISAEGATEEECYAEMEPTIATIRESLGEIVFGEEDEELEHVVARMLAQRGQTLATVEWGTGGLVAERLRDVAESDGRFLGGIVIADGQIMERVLGVPAVLVERHKATSGEVTEAMAVAWREKTGADLALAAGALPEIDRKAAEAPRVYFALARDAGTLVRSAPFFGERTMLKPRTAKQALNMVRLALLRDTD